MNGIDLYVGSSSSDLHLAQAILLYESGRHGAKSYHATIHKVDGGAAAGPLILPGTLLTREALEDALRQLGESAKLRRWSFVDECVLASGTDMVVWFTPPTVRHMVFAGAGLNQAGPAVQPASLWIVWRRNLWIFALEDRKERPTPGDRVFHSPHFNVWKGGRVCLGSMVTPEFPEPAAWMDSFYGSAFNHPNDGATWQVKYRGGVPSLWRRLLKEGGRRPYPKETLVPTGATIEQIVDSVMSTGVKQVGAAG